ncbi:MAG TPA: AAA family ATPase [Dehalococcoidales bacterium]|nr:AAA family ATPase [Dehalococcoidales bacterium]
MWQVVGQDRVVTLLQRNLERGSVAHAYLLVGPPHVGKMTLALELARALNCNAAEPPCGECDPCRKVALGKHADVQVIGLDSGGNSNDKPRTEISIEQVREIQHSASLPPFEGNNKVFIIDGAELMSNEAANCLLKTLEEPSEGVIFILLTANDSVLPDTVISRCQRLELRPLPTSQVGAALSERRSLETAKTELLSRLCHGRLGWALMAADDDSLLERRDQLVEKLLEVIRGDNEQRFDYAAQLAAQFSQNRALVQEVLDLWLDWWRDLLLVKLGSGDIVTSIDHEAELAEMGQAYSLAQIRAFIDSIQAAGEQLGQNANPRLALEVLMLSIPGRSAE